MSTLRTPIVSAVIGEGGSGGALALAVADRVLMLDGAIYSVIAPEGAAAILYRDATRAPEISSKLKLTARELERLNIIDEIVPEPATGTGADPEAAAPALGESITNASPICSVNASTASCGTGTTATSASAGDTRSARDGRLSVPSQKASNGARPASSGRIDRPRQPPPAPGSASARTARHDRAGRRRTPIPARVTGPISPSPTVYLSMATTGVTSAAVPQVNTRRPDRARCGRHAARRPPSPALPARARSARRG